MVNRRKVAEQGNFLAETITFSGKTDVYLELQRVSPRSRLGVKILRTYKFRKESEAIQYANEWARDRHANQKKRKEQRKARREANKVPASKFYEVGDIVVNTWGWEQTNVEFYRVVRITSRCIFVKEISQVVEEGSEMYNGMACNVMPGGQILDEGREYRLIVKAEGVLSNPEKYYYFRKWGGKPQYNSWYA